MELLSNWRSFEANQTGHQRKTIRIDTKTVRAAGRSTSGVKLLDLDQDDKVAAAMTIPPDDPTKAPPEPGTLIQ